MTFFLALQLEIVFVNRTEICRRAIKRTFADLYGVSPDTVDVSWTTGKTIVVQCAGKTFLHPILSYPDDDTPKFTCLDEDPVIVNLTDDEWHQLELAFDSPLSAVLVYHGTARSTP